MSKHQSPACLLVLLLTAGCALSPQTVSINPALTAADTTIAGNDTAVALEVVDTRGSPVIGHRGGVYSETATISTEADITATVRRNLAAALEKSGYRVEAAGSAPVLRVEIAGLDYSVREKDVSREITTVARINAVFSRAGRTYNNTYTITRHKSMLAAPGTDDNAELINATLAAALQRLLGDGELFGFITGTGR